LLSSFVVFRTEHEQIDRQKERLQTMPGAPSLSKRGGADAVRNRLSLGTFEIPARKLGGRVLFLRSEVLKFMKSLPQVGGAQTEDEETN
jgi:hypothetical protein